MTGSGFESRVRAGNANTAVVLGPGAQADHSGGEVKSFSTRYTYVSCATDLQVRDMELQVAWCTVSVVIFNTALPSSETMDFEAQFSHHRIAEG